MGTLVQKVLVLTVVAAMVGLLAWTGTSAAQTSAPTLTLEEYCFRGTQWSDFAVRVTVSGLDPFASVTGSIDLPDGHSVAGSISANEAGVATITAANRLPGLITVTITSPFSETKSLYVDCGTHFPTDTAQCKKRGWRDYGFKNRSQCAEFVRQLLQCVELHYQGFDPPYCPPEKYRPDPEQT